MATRDKTGGKTDKDLWTALEGLGDDLLDLELPPALADEELRAMGVDPAALSERAGAFVAAAKEDAKKDAKEDDRLSWQARARERRAQLESLVSKAATGAAARMDREAILARLDALRATDPNVGTAIRMAARKRKPEESSDDELRALLEEMEALRAIEGNDPE
jgi:hypothetical protein